MRFLDSLAPPASIQTDVQRFNVILNFFCPLFEIICKINLQKALGPGPMRLSTKYSHSEFLRGIPGFPGFPGHGPNWAGPVLGSTRARGKDTNSFK